MFNITEKKEPVKKIKQDDMIRITEFKNRRERKRAVTALAMAF